MHSPWFRSTFLRVLKFLQLKKGELISRLNEFCRKSELFVPAPLRIWILKVVDPNSLSFITFQCTLHDSGVLFSESSNFYKLKRVDLFSGGNKFCSKSYLFGPPFCISILQVLRTQSFPDLLDFNAFCMIQQYFSESLEISTK